MMDKKNAWEMTLDEYLGDGRVGGELQGFFLDAAVDGMNRVTQTYRNADKRSFLSFAQPDYSNFMGDPDLELHLSEDYSFYVISLSERRPIAMIAGASPYCDPAFRGRGIVSEVFRIQDELGKRLPNTIYTPAGLMNRARTHRLHIQHAVDAGQEIPANVMKDYALVDGQVQRTRPLSPDIHNSLKLVQIKERHAEIAKRRLVNFHNFVEGKGPEDFLLYTLGKGAHLALAIKIRYGGKIRVTEIGRETFHQVQIDDMVIDAFGIRSLESTDEELHARLKPEKDGPASVSIFDTISDYKKSQFFWGSNNEMEGCPSIEEMMMRVSAGIADLKIRNHAQELDSDVMEIST